MLEGKTHANAHLPGRVSETECEAYNVSHAPMLLDFILENTKAGTVEQPAMLLEIGGGTRAKIYNAETLRSKQIIVGNLDLEPGWGSRVIKQDFNKLEDGLFDPVLNDFLQGAFLSSLVISNTVKFFELPKLQELIASAVTLLPPSGSIIIHDVSSDPVFLSLAQSNHNGLYDFLYGNLLPILDMMKNIARDFPNEFVTESYYVGPVVRAIDVEKIRKGKVDPMGFLNYQTAEIHPKAAQGILGQEFQIASNRVGLTALGQQTTVLRKLNPLDI